MYKKYVALVLAIGITSSSSFAHLTYCDVHKVFKESRAQDTSRSSLTSMDATAGLCFVGAGAFFAAGATSVYADAEVYTIVGAFAGGALCFVVGVGFACYERCGLKKYLCPHGDGGAVDNEDTALIDAENLARVDEDKLRELWPKILAVVDKNKLKSIYARLDVEQALSLALHDIEVFKNVVTDRLILDSKVLAAMNVFLLLIKMSAQEIMAELKTVAGKKLIQQHPSITKALMKILEPSMAEFERLKSFVDGLHVDDEVQ